MWSKLVLLVLRCGHQEQPHNLKKVDYTVAHTWCGVLQELSTYNQCILGELQ